MADPFITSGQGEAAPLYTVVVGQPRLRDGSLADPGFGILRHYLFELVVQPCGAGGEPWVIPTSYEELAGLHDGLRERHTKEVLPAFPRKRHVTQFMYKEETEYLEEIRSGLQAYVAAVLACPALRADPEARRFLGLHDRGRGAAQRGPPQPAGPPPGQGAADEAPFRLTVLEADSEEAYFLRVQSTEVPSLRWSLIKTLPAMTVLHDHIAAHHSNPAPPAFPRVRTVTKYLVYGSSGAYKEAFRGELEQYFNTVLSLDVFRRDIDVRRFLELDEHTQRVRVQVKTACMRCVTAILRMLRFGQAESSRDLRVSLQPR